MTVFEALPMGLRVARADLPSKSARRRSTVMKPPSAMAPGLPATDERRKCLGVRQNRSSARSCCGMPWLGLKRGLSRMSQQ
jgi:hypothetical protein